MSSENEVSVKIVGDASGVAPATREAKGEITGLAEAVARMAAEMASMGETMKAAFAGGGPAIAEAATEMHGLREATEAESLSLREMALQVHEAAESFNGFKGTIAEIGEVWLAAFAVDQIKDFAVEMGESAEHIRHLADEFGITTAQVQQLQGVALGTGTNIDTLVRGMAMLDKTTATMSGTTSAAGKALAILGISADDGRSQMERLRVVADKFSAMAAGPERLALAMTVFNKSGREMLPILEQGAAGIEELSAKAESLGMVNTNAATKGLRLAEAVNEGRIAWAGLQTTLEDALAPMLTQVAVGFERLVQRMVESYDRGGIVRDVFDGIADAGKVMGDVLRTVGEVMATVRANLDVIVPIAGAFVTLIAGRYVAGIAAGLLGTTELRVAIAALIGTFELGGSVAAFQMLITGLAGAMTGLAAAAAEATIALLANPLTWLAVGVAGLIALYRDWTSVTQEQTTATNDLRSAGETLANTQETLSGKSKEALEQMKAETTVALDLAKAHLKAAEAALASAKAEAAIANQRITDVQNSGMDAEGGGAALGVASVMGFFAERKIQKQTEAYAGQKKAVDDLAASIAKLDTAIATAKPATGDLGLSHTPKEKKPKDDTVQLLEQQLTAKKMAWDVEQDAQNTAQQFSLESEKQFWAAALSQTNLSAKDRGAIEAKYLEASSRLRTQQIAGQIDLYRQDEAAAGKNADAKLAVIQQETAYIERMYGRSSDQYLAAAAREVEATKAAEQQKLDLARVTTDGLIKLSQLKIAGEEADDKFLVDMGLKSKAAALANEKKHQTDLYNAEMQGMQQRLALMKNDPNHDPVAYKQLTDQIAQAEQAFQNKMTSIDQKGALDRSKLAHQTYAPFAQEIGHLISLHQGFFTTLHNMWSSFGNMVDQAITRMVENWLVALATQQVASEAAHTKEILGHAKAGAAAAYHAIVGIPVVGPILAPAAAAVAFAGIMAFSAEGGMDRVPFDGATIIAHRDEMVLSARYANPLRDMLTGGRGWGVPADFAQGMMGMSQLQLPDSLTRPFASTLAAAQPSAAVPAGGPGGGVNNHYHGPVIQGDLRAIDTQSGAQFLMKNQRHVALAGEAAVRNGFQPKNGR